MAQRISVAPSLTDQEYLELWIPRCKGDFKLFCKKLLGIELNLGQSRLDKEKHVFQKEQGFAPVIMVLAGNRFGKTVYEACEHLYLNFYKIIEGSVIDDWNMFTYQTFNVAPSTMNTRVLLKTALSICRGQLPIRQKDGSFKMNKSYIRYFVDGPGLNNYQRIPDQGPFSIRFSNQAAFWAFTLGQSHGDTVQGDSWMHGTYDEFGRSKNPDKEIDDLLPRLFQYNGRLEIITTPDIENEEAIAYIMEKKEMIEMGELNWQLFEGSTAENEFVDVKDMEARTMGMSREKRDQILHGSISLKGACYFDIASSVKVFSLKEELFQPVPGHKYYLGLDTAGSGKDYWAVTIVDVTTLPWKIVYTYYDKLNQPAFNINHTKNIIEKWSRNSEYLKVVMDFTNEAGSIYYGDLREYNPIKYRFGTQKKTGRSTKADLLDTFRRVINTELLTSPPNRMLRNQIVSYKGPMDDEKQTTDALMSVALACFYPFKEYIFGLGEIIYDLD